MPVSQNRKVLQMLENITPQLAEWSLFFSLSDENFVASCYLHLPSDGWIPAASVTILFLTFLISSFSMVFSCQYVFLMFLNVSLIMRIYWPCHKEKQNPLRKMKHLFNFEYSYPNFIEFQQYFLATYCKFFLLSALKVS